MFSSNRKMHFQLEPSMDPQKPHRDIYHALCSTIPNMNCLFEYRLGRNVAVQLLSVKNFLIKYFIIYSIHIIYYYEIAHYIFLLIIFIVIYKFNLILQI